MGMFEWAMLGALMLGIILWCFRKTRRGLPTLDDDRKIYLEKIHAGERRLEEDRKNISASDHMSIVRAAMEDLLRLDGNPAGCSVHMEGKKLELKTPAGAWQVELIMNERMLRSTRKILHGRSRWLLSGFGHFEHHADPASLLHSLNEHLHDKEPTNYEPRHFTRRVAHPKPIPKRHSSKT